MKRKIISAIIAIMASSMLAVSFPYSNNIFAATQTSSHVAVNNISSTNCYVIETKFDSETASHLYAGCTFTKNPKLRANRVSSTSNASDLKLWAIMKVTIPVTTFTLDDGSTVKHEIADPVAWNSGWESLYTNEDTAAYLDDGESITYIYGYKTTLSGNNSSGSGAETATLFDSMKVPDTVNGKDVSKIKDLHGAVVVTGYIIPDGGYSSVAEAYTKGEDTATESGNTIRNSDEKDTKSQEAADKLEKEVETKNKVIADLKEKIETQKSSGNAMASDVLAGKTFSNGEGLGLVGTMPNYGQDYTETSYQTTFPAATGLEKKSDGTVVIKSGFHGTQAIQGPTGNATPAQVLNGATFSSSSGPQTGTMQTITAGSSNADSDLKIQNGRVSVTAKKFTGTSTVSRAVTAEDLKNTLQSNSSFTANAGTGDVLSGKTFYGSSSTKETGSMANNGSLTWNPSGAESKTFPAGYYSSVSLSTRNAWQAGYNQGKNNPKFTVVNSGSSFSTLHALNGETKSYTNNSGKTQILFMSGEATTNTPDSSGYHSVRWNTWTNGSFMQNNNINGQSSDGGRARVTAYPSCVIQLKAGQSVWMSCSVYGGNPGGFRYDISYLQMS